MSEIQLDGEYYIRRDGSIIGYIEPSGANNDCIADMMIEPEVRENGYATEAISQFVDRVVANGGDRVTTTTVISSAMQHALLANGFVPDESEDESNRYVKRLSS